MEETHSRSVCLPHPSKKYVYGACYDQILCWAGKENWRRQKAEKMPVPVELPQSNQPPRRPATLLCGQPDSGRRKRGWPIRAPPTRLTSAQRRPGPFGGGCAGLGCAGTRDAQLSITRRLSSARLERRRRRRRRRWWRRWDPSERSAASRLHLLHGSGDRRGQVKPCGAQG